jgi:hypothetical protein
LADMDVATGAASGGLQSCGSQWCCVKFTVEVSFGLGGCGGVAGAASGGC